MILTQITYSAEKTKINQQKATTGSQTFVTLSRSLQNHCFKQTIASPFGSQYCTLAGYEIVSETGTGVGKLNCVLSVQLADLGKGTLFFLTDFRPIFCCLGVFVIMSFQRVQLQNNQLLCNGMCSFYPRKKDKSSQNVFHFHF